MMEDCGHGQEVEHVRERASEYDLGKSGRSPSALNSELQNENKNESVLRRSVSCEKRSCMGAVYFSQYRYDHDLSPMCIGARRRVDTASDDRLGNDLKEDMGAETVPGGDFKYVCIGYSAWDEAALKASAQRRCNATEPVNLPYCEGLEVVSAAAMSREPELLSNGPQLGDRQRNSNGNSSGVDGASNEHSKPSRKFVPGSLLNNSNDDANSMDWDKFAERFQHMSNRIFKKMQENAGHVAEAYRKQWNRLVSSLDHERDRNGKGH